MWIAKFKVWHKTCNIRPLCKKYHVTDFVYILKCWTEKNKFYYTQFHILQGGEQDKKKFVRDFKKQKNVKKAEYEDGCLFTLREELLSESIDPAFDPQIIQIKPVIQRIDGYEDWEIASWNKKKLMQVFDIPVYDIKVKSIKKSKVTDIILPHISPKLSPKQKEAVELAVKEGYYNFPRKIYLEDLAKIAKVRRETFQEHLHKAEKKLIPFLTENK
ncbi:helix-turn-helix domain-containing protein [Candidatus Woesearchaeota archaeon]|nr:helix-turn-helix domain-containing protein [Candidatus Woesearchaeota archaeon]